MTLKLAALAAAAICNAMVLRVDAAATPGHVLVYSGAEPANADTAISTQTVLVDFLLEKPAFNAANASGNNETSDIKTVDPVNAAANGTATFFRLTDGDGNVVLQGSVTDTSGNGELKISSTNLIQGVEVSILSLSYIQPKSTV